MFALVIKAMRDRDDAFRVARRNKIATFHRNNVEVLICNGLKEKVNSLLVHRKDDPVKLWAGIL